MMVPVLLFGTKKQKMAGVPTIFDELIIIAKKLGFPFISQALCVLALGQAR